ncbi:ribonuclease P protein component [Deinococcus sp. Marseille-Q6407]|uniref:ribonuclease P protein component n=1 Tax=Deinococcus sp. Marseille-Q6407 TaxID=2969223 RepID=UPI0021C0751D|nr:ribonuclease P protein component [Deinococcus sp. Marseille-Q6407]
MLPDQASPSPQGSATPQHGGVALRSLKGDKEFRRVRRQGASLRYALFSLKVTGYRPRHGQPWRPAAQIGIVVPKKVLKHAVDRNRVRRRVREALRTLPQQGQPLPACRAILFPTEAALHAPFTELQQALAAALLQVPEQVKRSGKRRKTPGRPARPGGER